MAINTEINLPDGAGGFNAYHPETNINQIIGLRREPSTAYALGDIRYINALDKAKLVVVKAGTTGSGDLTLSSTAYGTLITDGTVVWIVDSLADGNYTAAHQNGIAGGADLTAYWESGHMSTNIQAGKFVGMHIGDYITKSVTANGSTYSNVKWLLGAFDPHIHCGDTETTAHHVLLIPDSTLQRNVAMNASNTTAGGYVGSAMWTSRIPGWATGIKNAFGSDHVLKHRELLSNAINSSAASAAGAGWTGTANNWAWVDVEVNIPNENMVYGKAFASSGFDQGDFPRMLPLYALKCGHLDDRSWFWLRSVASSSSFCCASCNGDAGGGSASTSAAHGGVRPYFLLR